MGVRKLKKFKSSDYLLELYWTAVLQRGWWWPSRCFTSEYTRTFVLFKISEYRFTDIMKQQSKNYVSETREICTKKCLLFGRLLII